MPRQPSSPVSDAVSKHSQLLFLLFPAVLKDSRLGVLEDFLGHLSLSLSLLPPSPTSSGRCCFRLSFIPPHRKCMASLLLSGSCWAASVLSLDVSITRHMISAFSCRQHVTRARTGSTLWSNDQNTTSLKVTIH